VELRSAHQERTFPGIKVADHVSSSERARHHSVSSAFLVRASDKALTSSRSNPGITFYKATCRQISLVFSNLPRKPQQ
jgi:hypothetical protein